MTVPNQATFSLTSFSIYAIVKIPDYSNRNFVIAKPTATGFGNFAIEILSEEVGNTGKAGYVHDNSTGNWSSLITPNPIPVNTFVHIAMTLTGSDFAGYYQGAVTYSRSDASPLIQNNNDVVIGALLAYEHYFDGVIDELLIYDRALSGAEIAQAYGALE